MRFLVSEVPLQRGLLKSDTLLKAGIFTVTFISVQPFCAKLAQPRTVEPYPGTFCYNPTCKYGASILECTAAILFHGMFSSISFGNPPPKKRQLNIFISNNKQ